MDKSVNDSCQGKMPASHLQKHLRKRLRRVRRPCKSSPMGLRFDIDSVYNAQKEAVSRYARVEEEIRALEKERADLEIALNEFTTTLRILERITPVADDQPEQAELGEDGGLPRLRAKRFIERALFTFAHEGKTAGEIREYISNRHGVEIQPNTLSVTLNRLKLAGFAKLVEGQKWQPVESHQIPLSSVQWGGPQPPREGDIDDDIPF